MKKKRLVIDVPEDYHTRIKIKASERQISIKTWVIRAIERMIIQEEQYK